MNPPVEVLDRIKRRLDRDGFAVVPGVFDHQEVQQFRREILSCSTRGRDLLSADSDVLRRVIYDHRLMDILKVMLGGRPAYFGDSTAMMGAERFGGWHKDNADRYDGKAPDWGSHYDLVRFGIYLQDHYYHSGGLKVRVGSHMYPDTRSGRASYVRTRAGDVVLWNLRTTHAGHGVVLRLAPSISVHSRIASRVNQFRKENRCRPLRALVDSVFADSEQERLAIFATFGRRGLHMERLVSYMKSRTYWLDMLEMQKWRASDLERIAAEGKLELYDVAQTLDAESRLRATEHWAPALGNG